MFLGESLFPLSLGSSLHASPNLAEVLAWKLRFICTAKLAEKITGEQKEITRQLFFIDLIPLFLVGLLSITLRPLPNSLALMLKSTYAKPSGASALPPGWTEHKAPSGELFSSVKTTLRSRYSYVSDRSQLLLQCRNEAVNIYKTYR